MFTLLHRAVFALASYCLFTLYNLRAFAYCQTIFPPAKRRRGERLISLAIGYLGLSGTVFCALPAFLSLLIIYLLVLLQFLFFFRGELLDFVFASGAFMFHIMNVKMAVTSVFILIYSVPTAASFRERGLAPLCTLVTVLLLVVSLEVFQQTIGRQMVQTLLRTRSQLRFVTSSMMFINIYLLILSVCYTEQAYSSLLGIFLLSTALLLFGAFYTSFWHAVKMSAMMEREIQTQLLEEQLRATREDVEELQALAFADTLTAVHNRRFGLDELNRLLEGRVPFCLCFLDIDHLKEVNDTFGHEEGDRYILDVVRVLSAACTAGATLSRMGGDEFMLLLPRVPRAEAEARMRELGAAVARIPSVYRPSVSCGLTETAGGTDLSADQILARADREMYRHKRAHRAEAAP